MKTARLLMAIILLVSTVTATAGNGTIKGAKITTAAMDLVCLDYEVTGICVWVTCTVVPPACEYDYSVKVRHNISEAVVTAYPGVGYGPWLETMSFAKATALAQDGGASTEGGSLIREQALRFKNVDVIGSPGVWYFEGLAKTSSNNFPFCDPNVTGYMLYFLSTYDLLWRDPTIETLLTVKNGFRSVGKGGSHFGPLYPRIGFVTQGHDYKAALVAAKRGVDIVRHKKGLHLYQTLTGDTVTNSGQWPPEEDTGFLWQQLVPSVLGCALLPDIDDTGRLDDPYWGRVNEARGNAWQLWRSYSCCERAGAVLIYHGAKEGWVEP